MFTERDQESFTALLNARKVKSLTLGPFFVAFFAACFAMAIGVVWEIYEYFVDTFFGFPIRCRISY